MSSPSLAEAASATSSPSTANPRVPHPVVLGLGSGLLLWTTFPPANWSWLAWVALVPLFLLVKSERRPALAYLGAWTGGMAFWLLAIQWVRLSDESAWLGWLAMATALSFYWPAWLFLARLAARSVRLPLMLAAPITWVAVEYARAYLLTGFPWYYLAHSQYLALPLIQVSDLAGSLGVSFLIALVNAWVVEFLTLPLLRQTARGPRLTISQAIRLCAVALALAGTLGYGAYRLRTSKFRDGPRVALLQSNLIQALKHSKTQTELLAIYDGLVNRAIGTENRPDLIVWPETSFPYGVVNFGPGVDSPLIDAQLKEQRIEISSGQRRTQSENTRNFLREWVDRLGVPMLLGNLTYDHAREGFFKYNSATLIEPRTANFQRYDKWHLVPFGEYVPLIERFPWLTVLTPYSDGHVPALAFGREPTVITLGPYRLATAICFEDTVPHVVRRFFDGDGGRPRPDVLLNLSNDGWFHGSSEHDMHLAVSVFRAVEHRVPLARAANVGISAVVNGNGEIIAQSPKLKEAVLTVTVPLDDRESFYSARGDWLGQSCVAVTIGLIVMLPWRRVRKKPPTS